MSSVLLHPEERYLPTILYFMYRYKLDLHQSDVNLYNNLPQVSVQEKGETAAIYSTNSALHRE